MNNLPAEKVSPMHPDKIADRIAGALVDYCYTQDERPKCAFEVLIGHGGCEIVGETSVKIPVGVVCGIGERISHGKMAVNYHEVPQDVELAKNQSEKILCGDNGIFLGHYVDKNSNHAKASLIARELFREFPYDAKLVLNGEKVILSQSNIKSDDSAVHELIKSKIGSRLLLLNQIGDWTGGTMVDTGLTGRKLANDFYGIEAPLGGGNMHGKDLSKADVTLNILCYKYAQEREQDCYCECGIGDSSVRFIFGDIVDEQPYDDCVREAHEFIRENYGSFEKLAEWGLF